MFRTSVRGFLLFIPTSWARHVRGITARVHRILAYVTLDHISMCLNMLGAPRAQIVVHERTRPLVVVRVIITIVAAMCKTTVDPLGRVACSVNA